MGKRYWSVRFLQMGCVWNICQNLNTYGVFWSNQIQTKQNVVGRWGVGGELLVLLLLGVCSLSACTCFK